MSKRMTNRLLAGTVLAMAICLVGLPQADAALMLDLRVSSAHSAQPWYVDAHVIRADLITTPVNITMDVWVQVVNTGTGVDGIGYHYFSLISKQIASGAVTAGGISARSLVSPFDTVGSSSAGTIQELSSGAGYPADSLNDVGSNESSSSTHFVKPRPTPYPLFSDNSTTYGQAIGTTGWEWKVMTITFHVDTVNTGTGRETRILPTVPSWTKSGVVYAGYWYEDGKTTTELKKSGESGAVYTANREPVAEANGPYNVPYMGSVDLSGVGSYDLDGAVVLLNSSNIPGSDDIVLFEWDLNNDGTYDKTGKMLNVTYVELQGLGLLPDSVNTIKLRVKDGEGGFKTDTAQLTMAPIPEPATLAFLALGGLGMAGAGLSRRRRS